MHFRICIELLRLGDTNFDAYDCLVYLLKANLVDMKPFAEVRDGLSLEDRLAENGVVVKLSKIHTMCRSQNSRASSKCW